MKTKLLLISIMISVFGYSQTFDNIPTGTGIYLNKVIPSPNTDDLTNEYFEFRGTPNALVPTDLYFIMVEGDGESGKTDMGKVKEAVQLGDGVRTFGSNGILALVANFTDFTGPVTANPYTAIISGNANIITIELTGASGYDVTSSSSSAVASKSPDIGYDGNFTDASASYMLISSSDGSPKNLDIDSDNDGSIDATGDHTTEWVLYDSVAYLDYDDPVAGSETGEYAYAQIVYARQRDGNESDFKITPGATIVNQGGSNISYMMRQGTKTGYTMDDWIGASNGSGSVAPNWLFSSTVGKVHPNSFRYYQMPNSIFGELNPTSSDVLSDDDAFASEFKIHPNPTENLLKIESNNVNITSVNLYDLLGKKVYSNNNWNNKPISVTNINSGVYILNIKADNRSLKKKIIIK